MGARIATCAVAALAAVDVVTGAVDPGVDVPFTAARQGRLRVGKLDVTPDGTRLVAGGTFTRVAGQERHQLAVVDVGATPARLADWHTDAYRPACSPSFDTYVRDVAVAPNGGWFVVVTTGARSHTGLCDTAARFELTSAGRGLRPTWVDHSGGDSFTAVTVTGPAVYVAGHMRWMNNPWSNGTGRDARPGPGAVPRSGIADGMLRGNHAHHNGGNGIVLDADSDRNVVAGNRVEDNQGDGIVLLGSSRNVIEDNVVSGNRIGVRANKPGEGNIVRRNRIDGNDIGLHAYGGASHLTVADNQVEDSARAGIILDAAGSTVRGGHVSGGDNAIDLRQAAAVSGVKVDDARDGVVVRRGARADLQRLQLRVSRVGVRVEPGASASLTASQVVARTPTRGSVDIRAGTTLGKPEHPRPLPWLALAGLVAVVGAVGLELLAHARERRTRRVLSPS